MKLPTVHVERSDRSSSAHLLGEEPECRDTGRQFLERQTFEREKESSRCGRVVTLNSMGSNERLSGRFHIPAHDDVRKVVCRSRYTCTLP
jgi:hypothetical protein